MRLIALFCMVSFSTAWGGVVVDNDFAVDSPLDSWQLNTNGNPIIWQEAAGRLRLIADGDGGRAVSMLLKDGVGMPVAIDEFTAEFTFKIDPVDSTWVKADGMVFFAAACPATFLGDSGGSMGWASGANTFPSIAIEIDTWRDGNLERENFSENQVGVSYLTAGMNNAGAGQIPVSQYIVNPRNFGLPDFEGSGKWHAKFEFKCGEFKLFLENGGSGPKKVLEGKFPFFSGFDGRFGFSAGTGGAANSYYLYDTKIETGAGCDDVDAELPIRVNASGVTYVDTYGTQWNSEQLLPPGIRSGGTYWGDGRMPISKTNSDRIYESLRYANFFYNFPVPPGRYGVVLHFFECCTPGTRRVFDVLAEGAVAINDYCPFRAGGAFWAASQRGIVVDETAGDGLKIEFRGLGGAPIDGNPVISAIEIYPGGLPGTPLPVAAVNPADLTADRKVIGNSLSFMDSFGYIRTWYLLGPITGPGANPGDAVLRQDYLTDGAGITEAAIATGALDIPAVAPYTTVTAIKPQPRQDLNPGGKAAWFLWTDEDDGVDLAAQVYDNSGNKDNAMTYAVAYIGYDGRFGDTMRVCIGGCSDDSMQVLVNGAECLIANAARGWCGTYGVQNRGCADLRKGMNVLMIKTFNGGGGFGFKARIEMGDGSGRPIAANYGISIHDSFNSPVVQFKADKERISKGDTVNFQIVGAPAGSVIQWDFDANDGLYVDATGAAVSHKYDRIPVDNTLDVTVCVTSPAGYLTTLEKRIVVAPPANFVEEFDGATWDPGLWLDAPHHIGRGLEGSTFEVGGDALTVTLPRGVDFDTWGNFDQAPKLLTAVSEYSDWAASTRVTMLEREPNNQLHAGLIVELDEIVNVTRPCYLLLGVKNDNIAYDHSNTNVFTIMPTNWFMGGVDESMQPVWWTGQGIDPFVTPVGPPYTASFMIVKSGYEYRLYYRLYDSQPWTWMATRNHGRGVRHVGLFTKNWGLTYGKFRFEYLKFDGQLPPEVQSLTAVQTGATIKLAWTNPGGSQAIQIVRNNVVVATIAGTATSYDDDISAVLAGKPFVQLNYEVRALGFTEAFSSAFVVASAMSVSREYVVFQDGVFPAPDYNGTQDAHIIRYRSWEFDDGTPHLYNTGGHDYLEEGDWGGGNGDHKEILVKFDLSSIASDIAIESAQLRLYYEFCRSGQYQDHLGFAHKVLKAWNEGRGTGVDGSEALAGEVTWRWARVGEETWDVDSEIWPGSCGYPDDHRGGAFGPDDIEVSEQVLSDNAYGQRTHEWVTWDITKFVKEWVADPSSNQGVKITQGDFYDPCLGYVQGGYDFVSSEHAVVYRRPMLVVKGAFGPPDCPDAVACAVDGSKVTLTWDIDAAYDAISIRRDGTEIATVGGAVSTYVDMGVAPGVYTYEVLANPASPDCTAVKCVATVGIPFKRGDANIDGFVDIADGVAILTYTFGGGPPPSCLDTVDTDDDNTINGIVDAIYLFNYLFVSGPALPAPGTACGLDGTLADGIGCAAYPPCE